MYCPKCGMEVPDNSVYCPTCGYTLKDESIEIEEKDIVEDSIKEEPKSDYVSAGNDRVANKIFAFIGFGTGIFSLVFCWVPFMFWSSIIGIIFGKLGSHDNTKKQFGSRGFVMSLIALIINVLITIAWFICVIILAEEASQNGWPWE